MMSLMIPVICVCLICIFYSVLKFAIATNFLILIILLCSMQLLLSSSVDKTVRLWQLGCDTCLRVYCHNNYGRLLQTCIYFCLLNA